MRLEGQGRQSPEELFGFGMLTQGIRGERLVGPAADYLRPEEEGTQDTADTAAVETPWERITTNNLADGLEAPVDDTTAAALDEYISAVVGEGAQFPARGVDVGLVVAKALREARAGCRRDILLLKLHLAELRTRGLADG